MGWLNSIGWLEPGALYFLAIVPALILAYLARERPRQATVSSVIAFRALHVMRGQRFGGRPRFTWTFFLELLVLCLAVLAMARPYLLKQGQSDRGRDRQFGRDAGADARRQDALSRTRSPRPAKRSIARAKAAR